MYDNPRLIATTEQRRDTNCLHKLLVSLSHCTPFFQARSTANHGKLKLPCFSPIIVTNRGNRRSKPIQTLCSKPLTSRCRAVSSCVELCHVAELLLSLRKRASLPLLFLSLSLSLNRRGRDDKRFQVTRKSVTCFPLEKKGKRKKKKKGTEYKFHARQLAKVRRCNAHAIRAHIDLLSLPRSHTGREV